MRLSLAFADHVENDGDGRGGTPAVVAVQANDLRMVSPAGNAIGIGDARDEQVARQRIDDKSGQPLFARAWERTRSDRSSTGRLHSR